jgi:hypothetical protein
MIDKKNRNEFEASLIAKAWRDEAFKQELISNPNAVYARELGEQLSENLNIRIIEETSNTIYLTLPATPQVSEELSDEALDAVAGGGWYFVDGKSDIIFGS